MIFNVSDENIRNIAEPTGYIYFLGAPPYDSSRYLSHLWARYQITPHFWLAGGYNYESKYLGNGTSLYLWLPEQLEWDAAGGYNWKWGRQSYSLTVNFQNIGNSLIREALAEEPWPRRVFAGLTVKF